MDTIFLKLQRIRCKIQDMNLKKSGKNSFAKFEYYELSDIQPVINKLCFEHNICTIFTVKEVASLTIHDYENDKAITFECPFVTPDIKGANATQNMGGAITYTHRYLLLMAFEITEPDSFDSTIGSPVKTEGALPGKPSNYPATVYGICSHCDGWLFKSKSGKNLYCENFRDGQEHEYKVYVADKHPPLPGNIRSGLNAKEKAREWFNSQRGKDEDTFDIPDYDGN